MAPHLQLVHVCASLCFCLRLPLRRPRQHQCQHLCRRRSGSCRCCCTQPRETVASPSFHGAACSSSGNCHCDGVIGADVGAGVDVSESVSDNNIESAHMNKLEVRCHAGSLHGHDLISIESVPQAMDMSSCPCACCKKG